MSTLPTDMAAAWDRALANCATGLNLRDPDDRQRFRHRLRGYTQTTRVDEGRYPRPHHRPSIRTRAPRKPLSITRCMFYPGWHPHREHRHGADDNRGPARRHAGPLAAADRAHTPGRARPPVTPAEQTALIALGRSGDDGATARDVAEHLWPNSPAWNRQSVTTGVRGSTMAMRGARLMWALAGYGYAHSGQDNRWHLTDLGRQVLTGQAPPQHHLPHRRPARPRTYQERLL